MRYIEEWIGKTDNCAIPKRVYVRRWEHFEGRCQCGCYRPIHVGETWQLDHITALINGGEHRESNLQPLLVEHHKAKTAKDVAIKSKNYKRRTKHIGVKSKSSFQTNRDSIFKKKMNGSVVRR